MSKFFAFLNRMKYIQRWPLMRNTLCENVAEHSYHVAVLAHALAVIRRDVFHKPADPELCAACALYHDMPEILTGDMPTPVKYFNPDIRRAYGEIEKVSADKLLSLLPDELRGSITRLVYPDDGGVSEIVHAADKLSAYIKCIDEVKAGNREFSKAEIQLRAAVSKLNMPELDYFMANFIPAFSLTLDELE